MKKNLLFNYAEYVRLSKEDGDKVESDSILNQSKLIKSYLSGKEDFVLYDTYVDDGFTGTNFNRPAFKRMIEDIEAGKVNCVIVKDLSRFGRDYIDTGRYLERYFPDNDVRFISIVDNIDSLKQTYDMLLPIKNIFNEQYARDISKKVHASMQTKQKAGEFIGAFASYGYKKSSANKNQLLIDEYAAGVIRKIFSLYLDGHGKIRIANILNQEGIICPSEYKKINGENYRNCCRMDSTSYWTYSTIHHILQNEMYIGNMVQGRTSQNMRGKARANDQDDWIIVKNTHEAIIDYDTWRKTQDLLKRRTRNLDLNSNISIFAGFLKCGDCCRALAKNNNGATPENNKTRYNCGTYVRSGRNYCTPHSIPHIILEKIILEDLKAIIHSIDNLREIIERNKVSIISEKRVTDNEINKLSVELDKIRRLKKVVYEDYREDLISKEEYIAYRQDYLKKEELLIKQLECITKPNDTNSPDVLDSPWVKRLLEFRTIDKLDRNIVIEMLSEIKVFENHKLKITYNFSNELETLFQSVYTTNKNTG